MTTIKTKTGIANKFKSTPLLKGITYGTIAISLFFLHVIIGIFSIISFMALYEYFDNTQKNTTGRDYFYLTVFVLGAAAFGFYVISNINI